MKAILVLDMPNECDECPCLNQKLWECQADTKRRSSDERPSWCPLKPLPQKSTYELADDHQFSKAEIMAYTYGITVGRNQVIEEITE